MTQNPKIYKIDKSQRLLRGIGSVENIIGKILNTSFQKLGYKDVFDVKNLKRIIKDEFEYFLYLFNTNEVKSDWEEFLPKDLTKDGDFTQQKLSLILFVNTEHHLYCLIGGNAYQLIIPFLDHSFGLNTYARIMRPTEDELLSIKSRGITGARAGLNEQFRDDYRIIDFIKFGKIPQQIILRLSDEISDYHFDFIKSKPSDRIQISVNKGIKIKKRINFKTIHKIIQELNYISELVPSDYLSSYKEITDNDYIHNELYTELTRKIFNDTENLGRSKLDLQNRFEYDLSNPNNIEKFYEADEYKLKEKTEEGGYRVFKIVEDKNEIYNEVLKRGIELHGRNNLFMFRAFLMGARITCYQNKKKTVSSGFIFHISTEFTHKNKSVFLVDTKWYHLRNSFLEDLKINTQHILKSYPASQNILHLPWNKNITRTEGEYNLMYNELPNYIVIDTIIAENLELCDVLYYDDNNLYLVHVKYGFESKIRELTNQILISARRLREAIGTENRELIETIYNKLIQKGINVNNLSLDEFKSLFDKPIKYILAFTSHLKGDLKVEDNIDTFTSNIARFSLVQCSGEMRANYYDLLTHQIKRI